MNATKPAGPTFVTGARVDASLSLRGPEFAQALPFPLPLLRVAAARRAAGRCSSCPCGAPRGCFLQARSDARLSLGGRLPSAALMRWRPQSDWCGGMRARAPAPHAAPFVIARNEATKQPRSPCCHCEERSDARLSLGGRLPAAALMRWRPRSDWCGGTRARAPAPHAAPFVIARSEATKQSGRRRRDRHGLPAVLGGLAMTTKTFRVNEEQHQACGDDPSRDWP